MAFRDSRVYEEKALGHPDYNKLGGNIWKMAMVI